MEKIQEILKIIDWNRVKARLHICNSQSYPYKKEIWWASLGQNIGVEMNGKNNKFERPVLVIKVFNLDSLLIAPITSKTNNKKFTVQFLNHSGELNSINLSQLRTISNKRLIRKSGEVSAPDFLNVLNMIQKRIIKTETPFGVSSESPQGGPSGDSITQPTR